MSNTKESGAIRLQKFLSLAGIASRRHAEEMIEQGRVKISGRVVTEKGVLVVPGKSRVEVDNKPVFYSDDRNYILFHKPSGCITTLDDPEGRTTVIDLLPKSLPRVFPVGRLDWDTEGLLLLTNDGDLAYRLTHPGSKVPRVYHAKVRGELKDTSQEFKKLQNGVELEDGLAKPDRISIIKFTGNNTWLEIEIHIGRNRIVRRMCEAVGYPVMKLRRVMFGDLTLDGLPLGAFRDLTEGEVANLYSQVGEPMEVNVRSKSGVRFATGFAPKERTMPRQSAPSRQSIEDRENKESRVEKRPRPSRMKVEEEKPRKSFAKDRHHAEQHRFDQDDSRAFNNTWDRHGADDDREDRRFERPRRDDDRHFDREEHRSGNSESHRERHLFNHDDHKTFPREKRDDRKSFPRDKHEDRKSFPKGDREDRKSFPRDKHEDRKSFPRNESSDKKRPFKGVKPKSRPRANKD